MCHFRAQNGSFRRSKTRVPYVHFFKFCVFFLFRDTRPYCFIWHSWIFSIMFHFRDTFALCHSFLRHVMKDSLMSLSGHKTVLVYNCWKSMGHMDKLLDIRLLLNLKQCVYWTKAYMFQMKKLFKVFEV